jgi:hypothetical protein
MTAAMQLLATMRINSVMQELTDVRLLAPELTFLGRTASTPAADNEIIGRFSGYVQISDIIAEDSAAVTYDMGRMTFASYNVPKFKHGTNLTESQVNQMLGLEAVDIDPRSGKPAPGWVGRIVDGIRMGIQQRMEALIVAMHIDSFSYDRLGVKLTNISWGMPADLKPTLTGSATWDNAATATPVSNIRALIKLARIRYGIVYNRITMSQTAFDLMISTTEFQNKARNYLAPGTNFINLSTEDTEGMQTLARSVLGVKVIELYDARYWSQDQAGNITSAPFMPITKVVLSSTQNDKKANVMDWANAIVPETKVTALAKGVPNSMIGGGFNAPQRGIVSYATVPPDLNPPNFTIWGVAKGFPRKWMRQATACLTVGAFSDSIPVGPPY